MVDSDDPNVKQGTVSGGPMYYIERGLGPAWKPMAVFFAVLLAFTAFLTGNAVQANTVADTVLVQLFQHLDLLVPDDPGPVADTVLGYMLCGQTKKGIMIFRFTSPISILSQCSLRNPLLAFFPIERIVPDNVPLCESLAE